MKHYLLLVSIVKKTQLFLIFLKGYSKPDLFRIMKLLFDFYGKGWRDNNSGECSIFSYAFGVNFECRLSIIEKDYVVEVSDFYCAER